MAVSPTSPHPPSAQPMSDLDRQVSPIPIEPHTAAGPSLLARCASSDNLPPHADAYDEKEEPRSHYMFKRLRRDMPLPGRRLMACMLTVLFMVMFLAGWNDASQGPLLPSLQDYYSVNYLIISCIWISNFVGFMTAGITNVFLTDRFGFGIAAPLGSLSQGLGYVFMCWGGPFPLFVIAYVINGFGLGLQDAQVNSLTSRLPSATTKMFLMHAMYGLGATVSPLVSTEFVKRVSNRVYLYFLVSLGLALVTSMGLVLTFRGRTEDQVVGRRATAEVQPLPETGKEERQLPVPLDHIEPSADGSEGVEGARSLAAPTEHQDDALEGSGGKMKRILTCAHVHYMAFYIMIYVGVEVTIGGWATSFILDERNGNNNAGYITTGYFGGITLGRVLLIPVTNWLGKHNSIHIYSVIAIVLELLVHFVHSIPANATFFALVGFVLGPMYPIVMMVVTDVMPPELQGGSIGWIASLGQAGSAMMPFITGAISNRYGVWILQPLVIAFLGLSIILWALVPRPKGLRA